MLQAMAPVDEQIAEQHNFNRLHPPRLRRDRCAKSIGTIAVDPSAEAHQQPQHDTAPQQILAEEKTQIDEPCRPKEFLPAAWRETPFPADGRPGTEIEN